MCGIVGYLGQFDARDIVINALKKLEYRGYDSCGVAYFINNEVKVFKDKGRINELEKTIDTFYSNYGIGHTRWATHGKPNKINSHPHTSMSNRYIIVHNGVIENYLKLKKDYLKNFNFKSETDTEVIANLLDVYGKIMDTSKAIEVVCSLLEGSFSLLIIDTFDLDKLYFVKNKTPLILGLNGSGMMIASDIVALVGLSKSYACLEDMTVGYIYNNGYKIISSVNRDLKFLPLNLKSEEIDKGNYQHYMLKEIDEQATIINKLSNHYITNNRYNFDSKLINDIKKAKKVNIVACGSSYYAGLFGKEYLDSVLKNETSVYIASELAYTPEKIKKDQLYIFISQSGQTADSIKVLDICKAKNVKTLAIVNCLESTIARDCFYKLELLAGKEIAVASTKAFVASITVLYLLSNAIKKSNCLEIKDKLIKTSISANQILNNKNNIISLAKQIYNAKAVFYIGRGADYLVCLEAALKLKEISYIHSWGYMSGELKHGSIALVKEGVVVIGIITNPSTNNIVRSNIIETTSRNALGITIVDESLATEYDNILLPSIDKDIMPILSTIVCQILAYYVSLFRNNDIDKPDNLAKSVTVE